jgi:hypothetical protein
LRLEQAGESLELCVESAVEFQIEIEDVSEAKAPQDLPIPGLSRIIIRQKTDADQAGDFKVTTVSANSSAESRP